MTKIFISLLILSLSTIASSRKILPELQSLLPSFDELKQRVDQGDDVTNEEKDNVFNMKAFEKVVEAGTDPFGKGSFGTVFQVTGKSYVVEDEMTTLAFKEVIFNNHHNSREETQGVLIDDIKASRKLSEIDAKGLYFPHLYTVYDITNFFKSSSNTSLPQKAQYFLNPGSSKDIAVLVSDFLELEAFEYFKQVIKGTVASFFHTRLKFMINIGHGLQSIYNDYYHCDIKPENLMFKRVSEGEAEALQAEGIYRLELYPGKLYQVKIIDFGLASSEPLRSRRCHGGTPEFVPFEFFTKENHKTYDLFAIAMMMLDMELGETGSGDFSLYHGELFQAVYNDKTKYETQTKNTLVQYGFTALIKKFWESEEYSPLLMEEVKKLDSKFLDFINKDCKSLKVHQLKIGKYFFANLTTPETLARASLRVFWNNYYKQKIIKDKKVLYITEATRLAVEKTAITQNKDMEKYNKNSELIKYYENMANLMDLQADVRIEFNNMLMDIAFSGATSRMSLNDFMQKSTEILERVTAEGNDMLVEIFQARRHYGMMKVKEAVISQNETIQKYVENELKKRSSFRLSEHIRLLI